MIDNIQEMQINLYKTYKNLCEFSTKYSTLESELTKLQQENKELKEKIKEITYIQVENADLKENLNFRLDKQNLFMDKYSAELEENAKLKEEIKSLKQSLEEFSKTNYFINQNDRLEKENEKLKQKLKDIRSSIPMIVDGSADIFNKIIKIIEE